MNWTEMVYSVSWTEEQVNKHPRFRPENKNGPPYANRTSR